jgi:hypothetical protein
MRHGQVTLGIFVDPEGYYVIRRQWFAKIRTIFLKSRGHVAITRQTGKGSSHFDNRHVGSCPGVHALHGGTGGTQPANLCEACGSPKVLLRIRFIDEMRPVLR